MGRERVIRLAQGVYARRQATGTASILIDFTFRGVRCRETMPGLDPDRSNHVKFAKNTRAAILADIDRGTFNYLEYFPNSSRARRFGFITSRRTVREVADAWLEDIDTSYPHSTARAYRGACERFIIPAIGELRIRDVTVEHIRAMFRSADIALKTARNYAGPLRAVFQRAIDDDEIDRNPMDRINVKSLIPKARHRSDYVVDPFDRNEIDKILEACRQYRPDWLNYWRLAFFTGLRTSELYGLEWSDVDLEARQLHVRRAIVEGQGKEPKTLSSARAVYLVDTALEALRRQRAATELAGDRVFINPTTRLTLTRYEVSQRCFDLCQKRAKVRRRNQYQTRHTYASNLLSLGENPAFIAKQLGHKDLGVLLRVYGKWISTDAAPRQSVDFGEKEATQ